MNMLVILGHPDPNSFNHAIASTVCETSRGNGHHVLFHDLYAEGFDPVLTREEIPEEGLFSGNIQHHCEQLRSSDGIVIVHPNWWGQPPAILKGWVDRVIRPGIAYRFEDGDTGDGVPVGLLKAKAALVLNTSNTPDNREHCAFGDPLELIWKHCIFGLCGVHTFHRRMFNVIITSIHAQRHTWLNETRSLVTQFFPKKS
ncbi:MAG: NAD(P)H-dependent oxidoreductase [Desulfomonilaceae bacterium]